MLLFISLSVDTLIHFAYLPGQNVTAVLIWGWDGAVLMQGFHCTFAIGTFVAPWIAKPFISVLGTVNNNSTNTETTTGLSVLHVENTKNFNDTETEQLSDTQVHLAYLIVGAYIFLSGLFFVLVYWRSKRKDQTKAGQNKNSGVTTEKNSGMKPREPAWYRWPMLLLMFFRFFFYVGLEITAASLLMTFAVKGMGWDKATGVALTACFRGIFFLGRASSVIIAIFVTPTKMIIFYLILINIGLGVVTAFLDYHPLILWVFISMAGFGMGTFYGSSMSWADKYLNMTGKSGTFFVFGAWVGLFIIPALTGYLFDHFSPLYYIYSCLGQSILLLLVSTASMLLAHYYHSKQKKHLSNQGQNMTFHSDQNHNDSLFHGNQENAQSKAKIVGVDHRVRVKPIVDSNFDQLESESEPEFTSL